MDLNNGYLQDLMPEEREAMTGAKPQTVAQPAPADETPADAAGATDDGADQGIDEGTGSSDADAGGAAADGNAAEPVDQAAAAAALAELDAGQTKTEAPRAFEVPADDFNAKRTELRTQKRAVHEKWANGELTDTEYFEQTDALDDQIAAIVTEQSRKATLADINRQNEERVRQAQVDAENQAMAAIAAQYLHQLISARRVTSFETALDLANLTMTSIPITAAALAEASGLTVAEITLTDEPNHQRTRGHP